MRAISGNTRNILLDATILGVCTMMRIPFVLAVILLTAGCVAGQHLSYDYAPEAVAIKNSGTVNVAVRDERPYVTSGDKSPDYVGHYRAGFGNTWDITTEGKTPFADVVARDLREEITALGFSGGTGGKTLQVVIREWNMDTYLNAKFWYALMVSVIRQDSGTVLAEKSLAEEKRIEGSVWVGPKYAVEKQMPTFYDEVIKTIARENPVILDALRQN